jgi:hypothetical protein
MVHKIFFQKVLFHTKNSKWIKVWKEKGKLWQSLQVAQELGNENNMTGN